MARKAERGWNGTKAKGGSSRRVLSGPFAKHEHMLSGARRAYREGEERILKCPAVARAPPYATAVARARAAIERCEELLDVNGVRGNSNHHLAKIVAQAKRAEQLASVLRGVALEEELKLTATSVKTKSVANHAQLVTFASHRALEMRTLASLEKRIAKCAGKLPVVAARLLVLGDGAGVVATQRTRMDGKREGFLGATADLGDAQRLAAVVGETLQEAYLAKRPALPALSNEVISLEKAVRSACAMTEKWEASLRKAHASKDESARTRHETLRFALLTPAELSVAHLVQHVREWERASLRAECAAVGTSAAQAAALIGGGRGLIGILAIEHVVVDARASVKLCLDVTQHKDTEADDRRFTRNMKRAVRVVEDAWALCSFWKARLRADCAIRRRRAHALESDVLSRCRTAVDSTQRRLDELHFGLRFADEVASARLSLERLVERTEGGVGRVVGMWAKAVPEWQWQQWGESLQMARKRLKRAAKVARARHEQDIREAARMLYLAPSRWKLEAVETELISPACRIGIDEALAQIADAWEISMSGPLDRLEPMRAAAVVAAEAAFHASREAQRQYMERLVRRDRAKREGRSLMFKAALILRACSEEWRSSKRGREVERAYLERQAAAAIAAAGRLLTVKHILSDELTATSQVDALETSLAAARASVEAVALLSAAERAERLRALRQREEEERALREQIAESLAASRILLDQLCEEESIWVERVTREDVAERNAAQHTLRELQLDVRVRDALEVDERMMVEEEERAESGDLRFPRPNSVVATAPGDPVAERRLAAIEANETAFGAPANIDVAWYLGGKLGEALTMALRMAIRALMVIEKPLDVGSLASSDRSCADALARCTNAVVRVEQLRRLISVRDDVRRIAKEPRLQSSKSIKQALAAWNITANRLEEPVLGMMKTPGIEKMTYVLQRRSATRLLEILPQALREEEVLRTRWRVEQSAREAKAQRAVSEVDLSVLVVIHDALVRCEDGVSETSDNAIKAAWDAFERMKNQQRLVERSCAAWNDGVVIAAIAQLWRSAAAAKESALGAENVCNEEKLRLKEDRVAHYALERKSRTKLAGMLGRLKETVNMMCEDRRIEAAVTDVETCEVHWEWQDVRLAPRPEDAARHAQRMRGSARRLRAAMAAAAAAAAPPPPITVSMSARGLKNLDFLSKSDPYVLFFEGRKTDAPFAVESAPAVVKSAVVANDLSPVWPAVQFDPNKCEDAATNGLTLIVMDSDGPLGKDDELGRCFIQFSDFVDANELEIALLGQDLVVVHDDDESKSSKLNQRGSIRISSELPSNIVVEEDAMIAEHESVSTAGLVLMSDEVSMMNGDWCLFSETHAEELNRAWEIWMGKGQVALLPALGEKYGYEEARPSTVRLLMPGKVWVVVDFNAMQYRTAACRRRVRRIVTGRLEGVRSLVRACVSVCVCVCDGGEMHVAHTHSRFHASLFDACLLSPHTLSLSLSLSLFSIYYYTGQHSGLAAGESEQDGGVRHGRGGRCCDCGASPRRRRAAVVASAAGGSRASHRKRSCNAARNFAASPCKRHADYGEGR